MAKASKKKKKTEDKDTAGFGMRHMIMLVVLALVLVFVLRLTFLFLMVSLLPTMVAAIVDRTKGRSLVKSVAAFNLAGSVPYVIQLWVRGNSMPAVQAAFTDPTVWLVVYAAAGAGWLLVWFLPQAAMLALEWTSRLHLNRLNTAQDRLTEDWGPDVSRGQ